MFTIGDNEIKELSEEKLDSTRVFDGVILHVDKDSVRLPNGHTATREAIRHIGAVCVLPVTDDHEFVLEHQYRYPIDKIIIELPAGKLDSKDEDHLLAAKRELLEETGVTADEWIDLGYFYPAGAYSDEKIKMFIAKKLTFGQSKPDEDEFVTVVKVPAEKAIRMVMDGDIPDAKTQIAILKYRELFMNTEKR